MWQPQWEADGRDRRVEQVLCGDQSAERGLEQGRNRQLGAGSREKSEVWTFQRWGIPQGALEGGGPGCEGAVSLL